MCESLKRAGANGEIIVFDEFGNEVKIKDRANIR